VKIDCANSETHICPVIKGFRYGNAGERLRRQRPQGTVQLGQCEVVVVQARGRGAGAEGGDDSTR